MYLASAIVVLTLHLAFVLWVIFGAFFTRKRPVLTALHVASFIWGLFIEVLPGACPLTLAENWLEQRARITPYQGGFLLHYLDALVYPEISQLVLTIAAAAVFCINVAVYWNRSRAAQAL